MRGRLHSLVLVGLAWLAACQPAAPPVPPPEAPAASQQMPPAAQPSATPSGTVQAGAAVGVPAGSQPPYPASSGKSLIDDVAYRFAEGNTSRRGYSAAPFLAEKGSLDADLVVAILKDRAQKLAARAVQDALAEAKVGATQPVIDLVSVAIELLSDAAGLQRQHVEALARIVVRAALAEVIVRTTFPDAQTWKTSARWNDVGTFHPTDADLPILSKYVTTWVYWYLGSRSSWLGSKVTASEPVCPAAPAVGGEAPQRYALCQTTTNIAKLLKLDDLMRAVELAAGLVSDGQVTADDVTTLALAASRLSPTDPVAELSASGLAVDGVMVELAETQLSWLALGSLLLELKKLSSKTGAGAAKADDVAKVLSHLCQEPTKCANQSALASIFRAVQPDPSQYDLLLGWLQKVSGGGSDAAPVGAVAVLSRVPLLEADLRAPMADIDRLMTALKGLPASFAPDKKVDGLSPSAAKSMLLPLLSTLDTQLRQMVLHQAAWLPEGTGKLASLKTLLTKVARLREVLRVVTSGDTDKATVGALVRDMAALASSEGSSTPALRLLGAVMRELPRDGVVDLPALIKIASRVPLDDVIRGLGLAGSAPALCSSKDTGKDCWPIKIVQILQEATSFEEGRITVNGQRLSGLVTSFGDDLSKKTQGRWFFHLTVGLGEMFVANPPASRNLAVPGTSLFVTDHFNSPSTWTPVVSEQIGFGYALPTWFDGRLTLKAGVFGSGLLYRLVLDSKESEAIILGGFVAADLYELIEIYAAVPSVLFYPPDAAGQVHVGAGMSFGVQVPLGDYLSALK